MAEPFFWGQGGAKLTPEQLALARAVLARKKSQGVDTSPVGHWTAGAARVVDALGDVVQERRLNNQQAENDQYNVSQTEPLIAALTGGSSAPVVAAPVTAPSSAPAIPFDASTVQPEIRNGIVETASALGIDPVDLGTAISYETGGTFDPTKAGPTTQWGQHKGLIQFGEPQAKQYGVDWNNPIGSQLGANGAVANYLRSTGVKPGMGLMDIYSAINAGGVGRYGASDANNGGAPGTVADKVNQQMAGHREKAMALLGAQTPQAAIEQAAPLPRFRGSDYNSPMLTYDDRGARVERPYTDPAVSVQPNAMAPPMPAPVEVAARPIAAAPTPAPQQAAPPPNVLAQALRVMADPRANENTKAVAQALIQRQQAQEQAAQEQSIWQQRQAYQQQQQNSDPLRQAQIAQAQAQAEKLRRDAANPTGDETFYGNTVAIQNQDGSIAYGQMGNKGTFRPIQLPEGQSFAPPTRTIDAGTETVVMDQAGNVISRVPKQNRAAAAETAGGTVEGRTAAEKQIAAPADFQSAQNAMDILDQIENHPARKAGTGGTSIFNAIPGTSNYDFQNLVNQAKSGAFLTAIESMKGLGALSNAEGGAATAAVTRMDTATTEEGFMSALNDYRKIVTQGMERARRNIPEGQRPAIEQQTQPQKKRLKFTATGELVE